MDGISTGQSQEDEHCDVTSEDQEPILKTFKVIFVSRTSLLCSPIWGGQVYGGQSSNALYVSQLLAGRASTIVKVNSCVLPMQSNCRLEGLCTIDVVYMSPGGRCTSCS